MMKKLYLFILILGASGFLSVSVLSIGKNGRHFNYPNFSIQKERAFKRGEVLEYRVHYGWINAGEAVLEVTKENKQINGKSTYHMVGTGRSVGAFNWFFKVRDRYETFMDEEELVPLVFIRRVNEGGFIINQDQEYYHEKNRVKTNGKLMEVPSGIQDMLSAFYYSRHLDYSNAVAGDEFTVITFVDDEVFPLKIRYMGKETISNDLGTFRCIKFHPVVQEGRVFDADKDLTVWITDDKNRIPVRIEAKLFVGSARMDLKGFNGLANPLAIVPN